MTARMTEEELLESYTHLLEKHAQQMRYIDKLAEDCIAADGDAHVVFEAVRTFLRRCREDAVASITTTFIERCRASVKAAREGSQ